MGQPADRELTITEKFELGYPIDRALRRAVREALAMHKRIGNPISTMRDGKVVWIPPEEIPDYSPESDD
jgi:hypothetical protein